MGQVFLYVVIAAIMMIAMWAFGYIIGTERRYKQEDESINWDNHFKKWCEEKELNRNGKLLVLETLMEVAKRME